MSRMVSPSATPTKTSPVSSSPFGSIKNAAIGPKSDSKRTVPKAWPSGPRTTDENTKPKADPTRRGGTTRLPSGLSSDRLSREYPATRSSGPLEASTWPASSSIQRARKPVVLVLALARIVSVSARNRSGLIVPSARCAKRWWMRTRLASCVARSSCCCSMYASISCRSEATVESRSSI